MRTYELHRYDSIKRTDVFPTLMIPPDPDNVDYIEYLAWVSEGNSPKPLAEVQKVYPQLAPLEFLDLFTQEEMGAVKTASQQHMGLAIWYDKTLAARYITLEDPMTLAGLDAITDAGLITQERHDQIVAAMQPV